jgi:hypothetical protein
LVLSKEGDLNVVPEDPFAGTPHLGNTVDGLLGAPAAVAVFMVD